MLTTQKLRDEFADASDIKMRILKDAISSQEEDMFETVIHLLAELIDINKVLILILLINNFNNL